MPIIQPDGAISSLPTGTITDQLFSPDSRTLYTAQNGTITAYDVSTGQVTGSWTIGTQLGGIDISADGHSIVAVELTAGPTFGMYSDTTTHYYVYQLDLASGVSKTFDLPVTASYPEGYGDVSFLPDDKVLLAGGGQWQPMTILDLSTGSRTTTNLTMEAPALVSSADDSHVLISSLNSSNDPVYIYTAGSGITASHENYAANIQGYNPGVLAISPDGNLSVEGESLAVYDSNLHLVTVLADRFPFGAAGLAFSPDGSKLYILDPLSNEVFVLSTSNWDVVGGYSVGATVSGGSSATGYPIAPATHYGNALLVSADGTHLAVDTAASVQIIDLTKAVSDSGTSAGNDTLIGDSGPNVLYGFEGNDILNGMGGDDTIYGGDGDDTITGGAGIDSLWGGNGNDTFIDTQAGLNGDKINDFTVGDKIIITDANIASFTYSLSASVLTYTGGSVTIGAQPGKIVASAAPGGGVQLQVQIAPVGTEDQIANQLASGYWNGDAHHWPVSQGGTITVDIHTLTADEQNVARTALSEWTDIIGVHFAEVTSGGQIVFSDANGTDGSAVAQESGSWSNGIITAARIQISSNYYSWTYSESDKLQTYLHEIGHALGLGHAGNYNDTAAFAVDAIFQNDSWANSVMSYFEQGESYYFNNLHFSTVNVVTPMQADILAMQSLYGLSTAAHSGDTVYGFNSTAGAIYNAYLYRDVALTIYDSGGNDTLDYSLWSFNQLINLNPETFSNVNGFTGNLSIARGTIIENAIGGSGNDTLIGNSADNVLTGNAGDDTLTGGPGADTLTGGPGNDIFKDTAAGHNGDTITDFGAGDTIVFTDANAATFTFARSGSVLSFGGGTLTLGSTPHGHLVAAAAPGGGVQISLTPQAAHNDFNGDGRSDILWRNAAGYVTEWSATASGGFVSNEVNAGSGAADSSWQVAGTGDFNGDGRVDILWRNTSGYITEWLGTANGGFTSNEAHAGNGSADTSWQVAGTGDFNGDGISDILWRNTNGYVTEWLGTANGGFVSNQANAGNGTADTSWQIVGTGDFDGDGMSDILWRNAGGYITEWLGTANGGFVSNQANAGNGSADSSWQVAGTGDFNGDGMSDILWRNSSGYITEWLGTSTGGFTSNEAHAGNGTADTSWQVAGVGDFNGDGMSDILWRNAGGYVTEWLGTLTGAFVSNQAIAGTGAADATWHVQDAFLAA